MTDRKRPLITGVRLSRDEMTLLSIAARDRGITVATFLRDCAVAKARPVPTEAECPFCHEVWPLNKDGRLRMHQSGVTLSRHGWGNCKGAHEFPEAGSGRRRV